MVKGKENRKRRRRDAVLAHPAFKALVALNLAGALYAGWLYFNQNDRPPFYEADYTDRSIISTSLGTDSTMPAGHAPTGTSPLKNDRGTDNTLPKGKDKAGVNRVSQVNPEKKPVQPAISNTSSQEKILGKYTVTKPKVYFHTAPDETTKRKAFINHWNKAVLSPLDDVNGFVYIVYTNHEGQTSKGWMLKKELTPINR
jgi:serine/threonine-protein kinase